MSRVEGRRVVHLTEAGTRRRGAPRRARRGVGHREPRRRHDGAGRVGAARLQHAAAHQVMSAGTPEQITAAGAALTEARKTIYRLLAE